ncbi:DUF4062 domain-containing protein [Cronobacter muytjensii]|uniref:DUF4062 domain-containing protein n=1 Tax=Cronobacter muytjensii TaxID=413501 RepID=UPI000283F3D0|nr:DUF4062 domain-containing protein [Cronobacter muytjensii]MDI6454719.1 DUF4062 domain-containing protein [Cronobacter muytjensii]
MDDIKYQVFVSSTYVDLIEARKKVIETVLSLYHFPVGMEMFSADDDEQWEIIRETIDVSDYYIVIIGHKYGSVADTGISYTEMEYDYAKSLGIPVLAFIRNRDISTLPHERESIPDNIIKLEKFIEKAKASKMCDFWDSIDDLATKVAIAFPKIMRRKPQVGWLRGNNATPKEVSNELAELSNENRELREKVRAYESQMHLDAPILKLSMINEDLVLSLAKLSDKQDYFQPISRADIPVSLTHLISKDDIETYNKKIPTNEQVDQYNRRLFLYECYKNQSIKFNPLLENLGRRVASDIYIEIEYPDFVVFLSQDNEDFFSDIPVLNIPETPLEVAERKLKAQKALNALRLGELINEFPISNVLREPLNIPKHNVKHNHYLLSNNANQWIVYESKLVILRAKKLLQSLSLKFDDITLIPIEKGEGEINFKIVCEELKEPIIYSHHIKVV